MVLEFEWDEEKNIINQMKHGISFDRAKKVFFDSLRTVLYDCEHSLYEDRWKTIGLMGLTMLMVIYTEREGVIRIISARKAYKKEEEAYYNGYCTNKSLWP